MTKHLLFFISNILLCSFLTGQSLVQGSIVDEANAALTGATVVMLDSQDSSMVSFAISDDQGRFLLEDVPSGDHILQVSFVAYKTLSQDVQINDQGRRQDIGSFQLEPSNEILQEVTVKAEHIPIGLIGDTISYNTAAFKTKPGASVEDLLRNLPGLEVERDGSIKAMGEDVDNVLVDGKEFFGDDPKIATRNLEAEAVDKVQVYDKKSEIAEFTGVDDGDEEKTINLKLKEDYKNGGFGNVDINGGLEGSYSGKLNYNRFSPSVQAAAIVSANNINQQSFTFNEYIQFMGGIGNAIAANNGMISFGEFGSAQAPRGISQNISGGINFNNDFSKKLKLTSHYFYLSDQQDLNETTNAQQFLENGTFSSLDQRNSLTENQNHRLSAKLDFKPNPFNQFIFKNNLSGIFNDLNNMQMTTLSGVGNETVTNSDILQNSDQLGYEGSLQYRKKFSKEGRSWISSSKLQLGTYDQEADLTNILNIESVDQRIQQMQAYDYNFRRLNVNTNYTEPLGNKTYLSFKYNVDAERENPAKNFFDVNGQGSEFNQVLSGDYLKEVLLNCVRLSLAKNSKNVKLNFSLGGQWSNIDGFSERGVLDLQNDSFYWLPGFSLDADLSSSKSIRLNYSTSIRLPTLSQLAPLPDNSNPNLFILGNPNLEPEYNHTLSLGYSAIDRFNFKNFFANIYLSVVDNRIINSLTIDENLLKTSRPFNTDRLTSLNAYLSYSAPIRPLKLKFRTSLNSTYSSYVSFINDLESQVRESNTSIQLSLGNRNKETVDVSSGVRLNFSTRDYEVNEDFSQNFFNYSLFVDGALNISDDWKWSTSFDFINYSDEFFGAGLDYKLWNMTLEKGFAQNKWAIKITAYDLLGQNQGISRTGGINSLFNTQFNTLTRYFMLGLRYKLGRKKQKGGIEFG